MDYIINRRPEIYDNIFIAGTIGVCHYQDVTIEIKNEPHDNAYGYNYIVYGNLPDGIQIFVNYRTVSFKGTPEVAGKFKFTLLLYVDPPLSYDYDTEQYKDIMGSESTSKEFTISIN